MSVNTMLLERLPNQLDLVPAFVVPDTLQDEMPLITEAMAGMPDIQTAVGTLATGGEIQVPYMDIHWGKGNSGTRDKNHLNAPVPPKNQPATPPVPQPPAEEKK